MFYLIPQNTEILKYDVKTISFFTLALSPRKPYNMWIQLKCVIFSRSAFLIIVLVGQFAYLIMPFLVKNLHQKKVMI